MASQQRNGGSDEGARARRAAREQQARKAKKKNKLVIFGIELAVIVAMVCVLIFVMKNTSSEGPSYTVLEAENVAINEKVMAEKQEGGTMHGYMNVALFGVDATSKNQLYKGSRSDSIMIASINLDTGDIKLVSVYRDTYLNLGNDTYSKCNAAYAKGGAEQAVKMLNMNLDMDIENFITVGYMGLKEVIDGLGGIYLDIDETELKHINNYQITIAKDYKIGYNEVTHTGYQLVDGLQAAAYCRIRYGGGDDFKRAERQREVIKAIEDQAKKTDLGTLTKTFNEAVDDIYMSFSSDYVLEMLKDIAKYKIVDENGFPQETLRTIGNIGAKGSCIVPRDLTANVVWLHQFLFEDQNYEVTTDVKQYNEKIKSDTDKYVE